MRCLVFISFIILSANCFGQWIVEKDIQKWEYEQVEIPSTAYYIDSELFIEGKDHTQLLQKFINENNVVVLPNKTLNINDNGLVLKSNSKIYFQDNTILKKIPTKKSSYGVLKIYNSSNIKVYNPQIIGDRNEHLGSDGEWGMGIDIRSAQDIYIYNVFINNCWGDGIYLGILNTGRNSKNITFEKGIINFSRRNGISITSGNVIKIRDFFIYNTYGTLPMAGIDVEPNQESIIVNNIILDNIRTFNSGGEGVLLYLSNLRAIRNKESNILINNHKDYGSKIGFRIGPVSTNQAIGRIRVSNSSYNKNKDYSISLGDFSKTSLSLEVENLYIDSKKFRKVDYHKSKKVKAFNFETNVSLK